jgi:hypothetical protein
MDSLADRSGAAGDWLLFYFWHDESLQAYELAP